MTPTDVTTAQDVQEEVIADADLEVGARPGITIGNICTTRGRVCRL
jgi:hypothetical protein